MGLLPRSRWASTASEDVTLDTFSFDFWGGSFIPTQSADLDRLAHEILRVSARWSTSRSPGPHLGDQRRLSAVAFADIVDYTILMTNDETRTHRRWMTILDEVICRQTERFRGNLVKSTGDGVLVEFPSAHDAVEWAREVQRQVVPKQVEHDDASPTILLRVAVHIGDVITTEFDVFGDGVNVAARLQEHSAAGGVILSEAVYDLVRGTIGLEARDLGFLLLKNFERPIRAYSLDAEARKQPPPRSLPRGL